MTAAFATWQPRYAEHGVATFPVDGKKPGVTGYLRLGMDASRQLAIRFADADAFGYALGTRSRISVLDVDTKDENVLADAMAVHGPTPIVVRSGSGHWQAWYRHNGERRRIRPDPSRPIDVLGSGFVVAPPSRGARGQYQFVQGTLDDLDRLPVMRTRETPPAAPVAVSDPCSDLILGKRNDTLWRMAMRAAPHVDDLNGLLDWCQTRNSEAPIPLGDDEVSRIAASAWKYESEGRNWIGTGRRLIVPHVLVETLAMDDPHAFALLLYLRKTHWGRDDFVLAKGTAEALGWTLRRFKEARDRLIEVRQIRCIHRGGKGPSDPPIYGWAKGCDFAPQ
ncbi:bifunctional DNA primase/polymerase [Prosthecomicrobium pneumaticum]|uniref:DNA primase/polymerase bifunctional N-terminal domain-containing protein n=1 Tax=Prosthecomicrobium pneumaticum TaxID=81895 RepID=A0A7W9L421_9HYPH|nr:bifunctional DNA primase/polymerase [Prosthecomicrobium pneumaticum]MBB5755138.1 hypothetical protein [Prosthecomicrobium pneumaticum]